MNPLRPALSLLRRKQQQNNACASVWCTTNKRRIVAGRPYLSSSGGVLVLESVVGPVRVSFPQWLLNRGRNRFALFTYRPQSGAPVRFKHRVSGPTAVVELPWRLR